MLRILRHNLKPLLQQHIARKQNINHSIQTVTCWRKKNCSIATCIIDAHISSRAVRNTRKCRQQKTKLSTKRDTQKRNTESVLNSEKSLHPKSIICLCTADLVRSFYAFWHLEHHKKVFFS